MTTNATPNTPAVIPSTSNNAVKPATPDLIEFDNSKIPVDFITDLLFENIGGQEILSVSRSDIVNGQKVLYNPIKNTTSLSIEYSPQNLFSVTDTTSSYFNNYSINLQERVPEIGTDETLNQVKEVVYIDNTNGDVVVNVINMRSNDQVEISVINSLDEVSDIIF